MIAVVIPYYQREPGILRRALSSVLAQENCPLHVNVIVVDDASPAPATQEIEGLLFSSSVTCQVIRQANAGPGAARNRGLDAAPADTQWIAFLDSDDEWACDHLSRAITALNAGHDWYFANFLQLGQSVGAFERAARLKASEHTRIDGAIAGLFTYQGDMVEQIVFGNVIGTPTVVFRRTRYQHHRFEPAYRCAGEDYLFWLALAQTGGSIAFSTRVATRCGRGVNVYSGAQWGSAEHLVRSHEEVSYRLNIKKTVPLSAPQLARLDDIIGRIKQDFASSLVSMLLRGRWPPWSVLRQHYAKQPSDARLVIKALLSKLGIHRRIH
jgi:succinoglycan biosynthesis protein ExoW